MAAELRHLLRGSGLMAHRRSVTHKIQEPVLAALRAPGPRRGSRRARSPAAVLDVEMNAATDNPLIFPGGGVADAGRRRRPAAVS